MPFILDKMTNMIDGDATCDRDPRMAAVLAVHVVSQVLDEAYVIANAARDSGQPWRYLSILNSFNVSTSDDTILNENLSLEASKGDCDYNENMTDANVVATSTPQKQVSRVTRSGYGEISNSHNDTGIIGQGDEDLMMQRNELATSIFINQLFDMSEVEHVMRDDNPIIIQNTSEPNYSVTEFIKIESQAAENYIPTEKLNLVPCVNVIDEQVEISNSEESDYSYLADAFAADIKRDVSFYIDDSTPCVGNFNTERNNANTANAMEGVDNNMTAQEMIQKNVAMFENAYITLNRDYDQCSEAEEFPVLQDPKGMVLQDVELITTDTSDRNNLSYCPKDGKAEINRMIYRRATAGQSTNGSRKSRLARRCRIQGSRLLSCLRGWWRRKTPQQHEELIRCHGVMRPLSPDARRRASSLLDNRVQRSPSPSRPVTWKFNTVNETVVNSSRWRDYSFDTKPEDCED